MKPNVTSIPVVQNQIDTGITTPVGILRSLNLLSCNVHNAATNKFAAICMEGYILFPMRPLVLYLYALQVLLCQQKNALLQHSSCFVMKH